MRYLFLLLSVLVVSLYPFFTARVIVGRGTRNVFFTAVGVAYLLYLLCCWMFYPDKPLFIAAVTGTMLLYVSLLTVSVVALVSDLLRLTAAGVRMAVRGGSFREALRSRCKGGVWSSFALGGVMVALLLCGTGSWRYKFTVRQQDIYTDRLPGGVDSLTVVQLSDLHIGSFPLDAPLAEAVALVNAQNPDLIFITGDTFNDHVQEIDPWMEVLSRLSARLGKFAVMGNHDYGDYKRWESPQLKQANLEAIPQIYTQLEVQLLNNRNVSVPVGTDSLYVAGVENWGLMHFPKKGDLARATDGIPQDAFTLLLSHDPNHFEEIVSEGPQNVFMTFSGHTHGFQMGVEISDSLRWSPSQYVYEKWAGLYRKNDRYLYVNRGLGYHGYKGRAGIWPEITVIKFKRERFR